MRIPFGILLVGLTVFPLGTEAKPRNYSFNASISREVLENYLSRSVTALDLLTGAGDVDDNIRLMKDLGVKFAGRTIGLWGSETQLASRLATARRIEKRLHEMDPEIVLQGAVFEIVTVEVNKIAVPTWVFAAFGAPVKPRNFKYEAMLFPDGFGKDQWQKDGSVPDITQLETRLWIYYLACQYIDVGCEALHFGQVALTGTKDAGQASWWETLSRVREYARRHARRHLVLCDAHVPDGGPVYQDNRLLFDFHSFPLRIKEVVGKPQQGELAVGYLDSLYGRSQGGLTPSGWACRHLPYLVEFDNWGASGQEGQPGLPYCWIWGYDEIDWFAHQTRAYRSEFLRYAWKWVRAHDPHGQLQMPVSRVLHVPIKESGATEIRWYFANRPSPAVPEGFGDEDMIKAIWNADR